MAGSPIDVLSRIVGGVLASATNVLGAASGRIKPLHPGGELRRGTVTRLGDASATGVPWLDEPGRDDVLVRVSRAIGLPRTLPDIYGVALRVHRDGAPGDLLFASTGSGRLTRFVLTPTRSASGRPLTTLLPYRSPSGAVLLAVVPESESTFGLYWARPAGSWVLFGRLELGEPLGDDTGVSFDPLLHVLSGLGNYAWVNRLREPAYWAARHRTHRRA